MKREFGMISGVAAFLAGIATATLAARRLAPGDASSTGGAELKRLLENLEKETAQQHATANERFAKIETRLDEHAGKLAEIPSTAEIVSAMEQLLAKTMSSLDDRLTTQAHSIDVLKTTVSQTDSLLERVLESLDSLQSYAEPADITDDLLLQRPAV